MGLKRQICLSKIHRYGTYISPKEFNIHRGNIFFLLLSEKHDGYKNTIFRPLISSLHTTKFELFD